MIKNSNPLVFLRNVSAILFTSWLIFSPTPETIQPTSQGQVIEQGTASQTLTNKKFFRAMLRQHFPDWEERAAYEQKMEKLYISGTKRLAEAKRVGVKNTAKLTLEEQNAFDYINGTGVYKKHRDPKTSPNIFDNRRSFLLKMEDDKMRNRFLESYNKRETLD